MGLAALDISTLRPQLRSEVVLGPAIVSRGASVHYMKDRLTNWFYRIGTREHFLLSRMDGSRTLQEIGAEYERYAGKYVSANEWKILLNMLEKRQLLTGSTTPAGVNALREAGQQKRRKGQRLFRARVVLLNPDAFLGKILPWLRFAFHPAFVSLALAAIVAFEIFFFSHLGLILKNVFIDVKAGTMTSAWFISAVIALIAVTLVLHEFAHGLTCKRFGGSVQEMGIGWRYLSPFPYCKLDDVILFQNRWHRVYAASAGVFINLLMLLPFALLWYVAPEHQALRVFCASALLSINFLSLLNLTPFIELDGYLIITYALNMTDLRKDAHALYLSKIKHLFIRSATPIRYPRHSAIYLIYGAFSLLFTLGFLVYMVVYWFNLFRLWIGGLAALLLFLTLALLLLVFKGPGKAFLLKMRNRSFQQGGTRAS